MENRFYRKRQDCYKWKYIFLKKVLLLDKSARYSVIDRDQELSIRRQVDLMSIQSGKFYYKPWPISFKTHEFIDRQYQRRPFYGVPRTTDC